MIFYTKTAEETVAALKTTDSGLTEAEVKRRLKQYGPNTIVVKGEPLWRKIVEPFASVMMAILALAALISLWHEAYFDVLVIVAIMMISAVIYYVQRFSTERILRTLRQRTNVAIEVLRGGQMQKRSVEQLVPGDVISVGEGGKVPADARLLRTSMLRVDESQLTGESLPISKNAGALSGNKAIYEQVNMIFQGSFVVAGEALAVVVATGNSTEFGNLAQLSGRVRERSPIEKKVDRLISTVVAVVAAFALVAFALSMYRGMELSEALRFVIALSVSAVPESMPVAISIILAFGMRRMAVKKALVRTMDSIETIGVVTTIATDKTGTLTRNRLSVQAVWHPGVGKHDLRRLMSAAINARAEKFHDPLDVAFDDYCDYSARSESVATFPFEQAQGASGNLWRHDSEYELVVKGAPERLLERAEMTSEERQAAYTQLSTYASEGYRVIALAHKSFHAPAKNLPLALKGKGLQFVGLVAVADELRPEAKAAIRTAQRAGIVVRMITGDHFETAYQIARQLGMVDSREQVFDSREMHQLSDDELSQVLDKTIVYSRVLPEDKYRLLEILKRKHITAMTGDGVNDVPAMTSAHVGLAMGSGTQIARDASDIILLDDNFKSIVEAVHEGRTIYANIKRMLYYLLSTNAGEALTALGALVMGIPVPLAPVQILWVNLVTDTTLSIPIGLEPGEKHNMLKKPQVPNGPLLSKFMISRMVLVAVTMATITLGLYIAFLGSHGQDYARTIAFNALVVMQWASALSARSDYEPLFRRMFRLNIAFIVGLFAAVSLQLAALVTPLGPFLHVASVSWSHLLVTGLVAFVVLATVAEVHKLIGRAFFNKGSHPIRL